MEHPTVRDLVLLGIFFLLGLGALGLGLHNLLKLWRRLSKSITISGIVVGHSQRSLGGEGSLWHTRIEYTHPSTGQTATWTTKLGTFWRRYSVGRRVVLYVVPDDADSEPILDSFASKYVGTIVCAFIGAVLVWAPVALLLGWKNIVSP